MLRQHVLAAGKFVRETIERFRTSDSPVSEHWRLLLLGLAIETDRLPELQAKLVEFGEEGDAEIAGFIEACLQYDRVQKGWSNYAHDRNMAQMIEQDGKQFPMALHATIKALEKLATSADQALAAIERFEKC